MYMCIKKYIEYIIIVLTQRAAAVSLYLVYLHITTGHYGFFFSQLSYNGLEICFLTISTINSDHRNY